MTRESHVRRMLCDVDPADFLRMDKAKASVSYDQYNTSSLRMPAAQEKLQWF